MNAYNIKTIGTHNGIFHQDEVVAIALLSILYDNKIIVKRTRDLDVLQLCDIVVDVGGGKFDHHMPGGNGQRKDGSMYASAGLIWQHFGKEILKKLNCQLSLLSRCFNAVDKNIIEDVDKIDNGVKSASLFDYIPLFIPNWNEDFYIVDKKFNDALNVTISILTTAIQHEIANLQSDELILNLLTNSSNRILELPNQYINWQQLIIEYNKSATIPVDFVLFPYPNGGYAAQAVPPSINEPFKQRISFPQNWAGLTTTLPEVSGVKTASFCHNNLFFVRANTKEDIYSLCKIAISK